MSWRLVSERVSTDSYDKTQLPLTLVDVSDGIRREATARAKTYHSCRGIPVRFASGRNYQVVDRFGLDALSGCEIAFLCVMGSTVAPSCLEQLSRVVKPGVEAPLAVGEAGRQCTIGSLSRHATAETAAMAGGKVAYNQDVGALIRRTSHLEINAETLYAAGLFGRTNALELNKLNSTKTTYKT
jgi:hypothetical protein